MSQPANQQLLADLNKSAHLEIDRAIINVCTERIICTVFNSGNPCHPEDDREITFEELAGAMYADRRGMVAGEHIGYNGQDDQPWEEYYLDNFQGKDEPDQYDLLAFILNTREGRRSPLAIKESHIGAQSNPFVFDLVGSVNRMLGGIANRKIA